jgi:hypothetical protein
MRFTSAFLGAFALAAMAGGANAALISTIEGNDCSGVFGQGFENCAVNGSPIIIKFDVSGSIEINTALFPTVSGSEFTFSSTSSNGSSGTWIYRPGAGDPLITFYVAKGSNSFNLFSNDGDPNTGDWVTPLNNGGNRAGLSHLSFYDTGATTPAAGAGARACLAGDPRHGDPRDGSGPAPPPGLSRFATLPGRGPRAQGGAQGGAQGRPGGGGWMACFGFPASCSEACRVRMRSPHMLRLIVVRASSRVRLIPPERDLL